LQIDYYVILIASIEQRNSLCKIVKHLNKKNLKVYDGTLKLGSLPQVIANSDLFIGGDSGMTHLALKLKKSLIAIIGGGNYGRFLPYKSSEEFNFLFKNIDCFNCEWNCIHPEKYCITEVSYESVYSKVRQLL